MPPTGAAREMQSRIRPVQDPFWIQLERTVTAAAQPPMLVSFWQALNWLIQTLLQASDEPPEGPVERTDPQLDCQVQVALEVVLSAAHALAEAALWHGETAVKQPLLYMQPV